MNKSQFNSLTLIEQVNFFNEKLKSGLNITQVCSELNISYNTIRDRFTKNFYTYNKFSNCYECVEKIFPLDEEAIEKALEKIVTKVFNNPCISSPNQEGNVTKLLIAPKEDKIINRSFRIYENSLTNFIDFCNKSNYNQYDILSLFIDDGIKKYSL